MARLVSIVVVLFGLLLAGCGSQPEPPLRVGTNLWPGYEPLYLARQRGDLPPEVARVVEYPSATTTMEAFRERLLDVAALTLDEALLLRAEGVALRVFLVTDVSHGADVLVARPGIERLADLRGRAVAYEAGALGAFMLDQALARGGLRRSEIRRVNLSVDQHVAAYRAGLADAFVTFEPVRSRLLAEGATILFSSRDIPGKIVDVLVVHPDLLARRAGDLRRLVSGWFRALAFMGREPGQAYALMAPRLGLSPAGVAAAYAGLVLPDLDANRTMLGGRAPGIEQAAAELVSSMVSSELLPAPVAVNDLATADLLPEGDH